jgi:hypothetical protein
MSSAYYPANQTQRAHTLFNALNNWPLSHFISNVLIVATGTAGAQAITMVFAPVIICRISFEGELT